MQFNSTAVQWRGLVNRPAGPTQVASSFDALNYYETYCGELYSGSRVCIEMSKREYASGVLSYVYYLLGAGDSTFTFRLGSSGGNARILHIPKETSVVGQWVGV